MSSINKTDLLPRSYATSAIQENFLSSYLITTRQRTETLQPAEIQGLKEIRQSLIEEYEGKELMLNDCLQGFYLPGFSNHALIYVQGNGSFLETAFYIPLAIRDALQQKNPSLRPHIMLFNLRGVGQSTGIANPITIQEDLFSVFKHLVDNCSIPPSNIVIYGHSMGSYLGSFGASYIQEIYQEEPIHFVSDRSFTDIKTRLSSASSIKSWAKKIFAQALLTSSSWSHDSIAALETLKGRVVVLYDRKDQVVPFETSVACALTKKSVSTFECIDLTKIQDDFYDAHNIFPEDKHLDAVLEKLQSLWLD